MTNTQMASLFYGDERYGRNSGYYCLLDAIRDIFERGDAPLYSVDLFTGVSKKPEKLISEFTKEITAGFVNGGIAQLLRPNAFILPQGRCAEHLLFSTLSEILKREQPST